VHTGEALRDADRFFGKTVILAARIAAQAQGGEVMVSSLVRELVASAGDLRFGAAREVELKGLSQPQRSTVRGADAARSPVAEARHTGQNFTGGSVTAAPTAGRFGTHGRILIADLSTRTSRVEPLEEEVYKRFLGGYGLGAYLMWKHFPAGTDALAPEACFAIVSGLLTGARTPFSGRIQIVGKSPLTASWADSNSGGSVASQLAARATTR
jgi:hypothetical protein